MIHLDTALEYAVRGWRLLPCYDVDTDGIRTCWKRADCVPLPEAERARRAERARKVFYLRLAKKAAATRARRTTGDAAD
jgi:hypothetical protein